MEVTHLLPIVDGTFPRKYSLKQSPSHLAAMGGKSGAEKNLGFSCKATWSVRRFDGTAPGNRRVPRQVTVKHWCLSSEKRDQHFEFGILSTLIPLVKNAEAFRKFLWMSFGCS